jgi:acyl carrier protein
MMSTTEEVIENVVRAMSAQHTPHLPLIEKSTQLEEELGFTPWMVFELLARLTQVLDVDPLEDEDVLLSEVRTVGDLCNIYDNCLTRVE